MTPLQHPLRGYFSTAFVNFDQKLGKTTIRLGHSLVFDFHSCFVSLGPFAVTVNYRGDVGRETNPAPGSTLGGHCHVSPQQ